METEIDKWEHGTFLDEMDESITKPFINSIVTTISNFEHNLMITRVDGLPIRTLRPQDEEVLDAAVRRVQLRTGSTT